MNLLLRPELASSRACSTFVLLYSTIFHLCGCDNGNESILLAFLVKFVANPDHDRMHNYHGGGGNDRLSRV